MKRNGTPLTVPDGEVIVGFGSREGRTGKGGVGKAFPCQVPGQREVVIWPGFAPLQADLLASAIQLLNLV